MDWNDTPYYKSQYKTTYAYTLKDLVSNGNDYSQSIKPYAIRTTILNWNLISQELQTILNSEKTLELWESYILPKFFDEYIAISNIKLDDLSNIENNNNVYGRFYRLFESILLKTYTRYSKLIDIYKEQENNLLNQVKSRTTSKGRINEIPQASDVDPYDTKFANNSNVNEVEVSSDSNSIPQKLREIRNMWDSIYREWCGEFEPLFIYINGD